MLWKAKRRKLFLIVAGLIASCAASPFLYAAIAFGIHDAASCGSVMEGECLVLGYDIRPFVLRATIAWILLFFTVPAGAVAMVAWFVFALVTDLRKD